MGMKEQEAEVASTFLGPGLSRDTAGRAALARQRRAPGTTGTQVQHPGQALCLPAQGFCSLPAAMVFTPGRKWKHLCCSRTRGIDLHIHVYTYIHVGRISICMV